MKQANQIIGSLVTSVNMTFLRTEKCHGCQMMIEVYKTTNPFTDEEVEVTKGCRCEEVKFVSQMLEESERKVKEKRQRMFKQYSLISKDLEKATFDNYIPTNKSQAHAKKVSLRYVEIFNLDEPRNLLFTGKYGIGKSHLAKVIADGVMDKGYDSIFISVTKLITKFRSSYNKGSEYTEEELIEALNTVDLLVLDDLGSEKATDWALEKLFEIVDQRQGMHTIYTSNLNEEALFEKLGE